MKTSLKGSFRLPIVSSGFFMDVWILSRHLGFKMQKVFLFALHECLGVLLHWDHHNSISRLDIFGKEPGCKSVRGLVYVFSAPHPGCVVALLWGCGCQRSYLGQARGLLFFFLQPCVDTQTPAPTPGPVSPEWANVLWTFEWLCGLGCSLDSCLLPDLSPAIPQYFVIFVVFKMFFQVFFGSPLFHYPQ